MASTLLHPKNVQTLPTGEWRDTKEAALVLRVRDSGARTWVLRYGKKQAKLTLAPADGRQGSLDLSAARREAAKRAHEIALVGARVFAEKARTAKATARIAPLFGAYAESLVAKADIRPSTRRGWESILKASLVPTLGHLRVVEIGKPEIVRALGAIRDRSVWAADSAHKLLTWVFRIATERDVVTASPMTGLRRADYRVRDGGRRKTVATPSQLRALWNAAESQGDYGQAVRLAMLTLARRAEIFDATVSEFDLSGKAWRIPADRRKNGEPLSVPLSETAIAIVERLVARAEERGRRHLLPGDAGALKPTSKAWARLLIASGIEKERHLSGRWSAHELRFHDLRRAGRSIMETELEIPASVAEGVLGHLAPSLNRTYSPEGVGIRERARAHAVWDAYLMQIAEDALPAKGRVVLGVFGS
jgi:integrase